MARHMTFHIGEFARMTGVNKRTLHYYDSEGIFQPDSVEPNGYRAYSSRQFYPFYMIRMFRDMGLDLAEIKEYMEGRTPEKFGALLAGQEEWLDQEMAKLKRMKQIVINQRRNLQKARHVQLDTVEEVELPEQRLVVSEKLRQLYLKEDWEGVEQKFAAHMRDVMEGEILTGYTFGAMVAQEDFMRPGFEQVVSCFYVPTDKAWRNLPKGQRRLRPAGRFAVTYFGGDYMDTTAAYQRLRNYMAEHDLIPAGVSYEESLLEDMSTSNVQEFITRIAVPVQGKI
ncbi:DNA-binding transcriptional regulator, MerR family [Selenomonas ruminantium]|uniref:DNA-binding transcriptional regulator, MerR family n=1 Tax=Selenomonas ruminantium TaxID=971 RepID=A0A1M6VX21_SELRU|nr:MerR family transcriptional regulator [Selenomonas ruminantium]SHK85938.1 DNA-binding transcriptional regulator, MerR family [Selenomonas ruminantium]